MLFAGFVVAQQFALQHVFEEFGGEMSAPPLDRARRRGRQLERVVGGARVAIGEEAMRNRTSSLASIVRCPRPRSLSFSARRSSSTISGVGSASRM